MPLIVFIFQTRKAHGVELQGSIIIFDEAHNLVSTLFLEGWITGS